MKTHDEHARAVTDIPSFNANAALAAAGPMTSEFIEKNLPPELKKHCVTPETVDPSTIYFVTGVIENRVTQEHENAHGGIWCVHGDFTLSGFKLKSTGQWHLAKREVDEGGDIEEFMMNNGREFGIKRTFSTRGKVNTLFHKDGSPCGEYIWYNADGSISSTYDHGNL